MLTSIIPGDALKIAGDLIHHVRRKHGIPSNCQCARSQRDSINDGLMNGTNQVCEEAESNRTLV